MTIIRDATLICAMSLVAFSGSAANHDTRVLEDAIRAASGKVIGPLPLYEGDIPNSKPTADQESSQQWLGLKFLTKVSRPTYTAYLPPPSRASGAAVLIFPGGGYSGIAWNEEGQPIAAALQDHGIAAVLVKYRLPSAETMVDKSMGPLQDAQQALRQVRHRAKEWGIDPQKVGAMGFSAGGHLASMLGTHFETALIPNPDNVSLRPDFLMLIYPVTSMADGRAQRAMRERLLGEHPTDEQVKRFSSTQRVSDRTPPTLLLAASNDSAVDYDHAIEFYRVLRQHAVSAQLVLFERGQHGFFELTFEEWTGPMWGWLNRNGWIGR